MTNPHEDFAEQGFLSETVEQARPYFRIENPDWFRLADDTNAVLMRTAMSAMEQAKGPNWSREAVAVRLLLRASGTLQGIVLLTERGMAVQARMLVRSIIEDGFVAAALIDRPAEMIALLKKDAEASRRNQGKFIVAQQLGDSRTDRARLQRAVDALDHKAKTLKPKEVASMGSMLPDYLRYLRLSDDAVHPSAKALHKHVAVSEDGSRWNYKMGPADVADIAATLHGAVMAALPLGIVVTQLLPEAANNLALQTLGERFRAMPQPLPI